MKELKKEWCMCKELKAVYRDCYATCSICGGQDAYGLSSDRPKKYKKKPIATLGPSKKG